MSAAVLSCEDLVIHPVGAPNAPVVKGISFTLQAGEVLGLIGESGAGKTTLGLAALGHLRAGLAHGGGAMRYRGADLLTLPAAQLRDLRGSKIAYVAQSAAASFNPAMTILAQITEPLRVKGATMAQVMAELPAVLQVLGLPSAEVLAARYPHQLSGGQLQRAMIAMALLPKPEIIVFDEPTTALDSDTEAEVVRTIREAIALTGVSALYISHDLELVMGLADRVMVLKGGLEIEKADVATLRAGPQSAYARALLGARQIPSARAPDRPEPVLRVQDLSIAHAGGRPLFKGLDFTLHRGETLALTGPSGSGKSSVMRAITGLLPPVAGEVYLQGQRLSPKLEGRDRKALAAIQIVHQLPDLALNPAHKIETILARGLKLAGRAADAASLSALMRDVDLDPALLARKPGALSGGQKQRVCIARALASGPSVLICDEPTAALDPLVAKEVLATLVRLQENSGMACLLITHDRKLVASFCHREISLLDHAA